MTQRGEEKAKQGTFMSTRVNAPFHAKALTAGAKKEQQRAHAAHMVQYCIFLTVTSHTGKRAHTHTYVLYSFTNGVTDKVCGDLPHRVPGGKAATQQPCGENLKALLTLLQRGYALFHTLTTMCLCGLGRLCVHENGSQRVSSMNAHI